MRKLSFVNIPFLQRPVRRANLTAFNVRNAVEVVIGNKAHLVSGIGKEIA